MGDGTKIRKYPVQAVYSVSYTVFLPLWMLHKINEDADCCFGKSCESSMSPCSDHHAEECWSTTAHHRTPFQGPTLWSFASSIICFSFLFSQSPIFLFSLSQFSTQVCFHFLVFNSLSLYLSFSFPSLSLTAKLMLRVKSWVFTDTGF